MRTAHSPEDERFLTALRVEMRAVVDARGMSVAEASRRMGSHERSLTNTFSQGKGPSVVRLWGFVQAFGVSADELFARAEKRQEGES